MKAGYIVQTFTEQGTGKKSTLLAGTPIQCMTAEEAINRAERFSETKTGVLAVSQMYDGTTGDYGETKVLAKFGKIPNGIIEDE